MDAISVLKKFFGYDHFRSGQEEIVSHILNGQDVLGIMPTGAREVYLLSGSCSYVFWGFDCYFSFDFSYERSS